MKKQFLEIELEIFEIEDVNMLWTSGGNNTNVFDHDYNEVWDVER